MRNRELLVHVIIKNSPNLTFSRPELMKWLEAYGKTKAMARWLAYNELKNLPIKEIVKNRFKVLIDPCDFIRQPDEILEKSRNVEKQVEKSNNEAKEVIEYLNQITGSRYKLTSSTLSKINARMKEGHKVEDFKRVIDLKSKEWTGTKFEAYLRPETLFSTKFESYVNQKEVIRPQSKVEQMAGYDFTKYIKGA